MVLAKQKFSRLIPCFSAGGGGNDDAARGVGFAQDQPPKQLIHVREKNFPIVQKRHAQEECAIVWQRFWRISPGVDEVRRVGGRPIKGEVKLRALPIVSFDGHRPMPSGDQADCGADVGSLEYALVLFPRGFQSGQSLPCAMAQMGDAIFFFRMQPKVWLLEKR